MTALLPYKKILIFGLIGLFALAVSLSIHAQEAVQVGTGKVGIQVSSPIYNFGIEPGKSAQEKIKIRNVSDTTQTFYPEVFDFKPAGETGTPQFLTGIEDESYTYSLASWINISREGITLKPNESAALNFTINVPKTAEAGGRYAGILFGTTPSKAEGAQVAISNKVGALVLVRVAGDAKELANLKEFSSPKNFYEYGPVDFVVRVENAGNVHVVPKGTIEIKDTFGKKVSSLAVNEGNGNVLPDSIRRFDKENGVLTWKPQGFTLGRYSANLLLNYGSPAKQLSATLTFWIVPWKLLLVILLAIIVLILLLVFLIKKYNQWVVGKAEKKKEPPRSQIQEESQPTQNEPPAQEQG